MGFSTCAVPGNLFLYLRFLAVFTYLTLVGSEERIINIQILFYAVLILFDLISLSS